MEQNSTALWETFLTNKNRQVFFCKALIRSIESIQSGRYSDFDGLTRSNCCQGIALLAGNFIDALKNEDLDQIYYSIKEELYSIEHDNLCEEFTSWIPSQLFDLASLYLLCKIRYIAEGNRLRSRPNNLKEISHISNADRRTIVNDLQCCFSNIAANFFGGFRKAIPGNPDYLGLPVDSWFKYVQGDYLREDSRGIKYPSCLYSLQVCFAHMTFGYKKIAIVNDILDPNLNHIKRMILLFQGDGKGNLRKMSSEELVGLKISSLSECSFVLSGYSVAASEAEIKHIENGVIKQSDQLQHLILGGSMHHPQFPLVGSDPTFDSSPIQPRDSAFQKVLSDHKSIPGVSYADPTIFRYSHAYPASLAQVIMAMKLPAKDTLRKHFICSHALKRVTESNVVAL